MLLSTTFRHIFTLLRARSQQRLRELYHDEGTRYKVRRVMSRCLPLYFRKECPLCGLKFHQFEDGGIAEPILDEIHCVGGGFRSNIACPVCHSTDRERLVYLYLTTKTSIFSQPLRVLHIAPEPQLQRILQARSSLEYLSADLCSPLAMVKIDLTQTTLKSNFFDVIICNHVLEHIPEDGKAMSELFRMLKPGGWAILQVPFSLSLPATIEDPTVTDPKERRRRYGQEDHVRIYAAHDYRSRLIRAGFNVRTWSAVEEHGDTFVRRYSLIREEKLYVCSKPNGEHGVTSPI